MIFFDAFVTRRHQVLLGVTWLSHHVVSVRRVRCFRAKKRFIHFVMANRIENKKMLKCLICDKNFSTRQSLSFHKINQHGIKTKQEATENWKCQEEKCQFRCSQAELFRNHLHEHHDFQCEMKILNFNNFGEFKKWKNEEENKYAVSFVSPRGRAENENETTYYYICNRSGVYTPKVDDLDRKRELKSQGSVKTNLKCTSQITARESKINKTLNVVYWLPHYGHKKTYSTKKFEKEKIIKRLQMINVRHRMMQQMDIEKYRVIQVTENTWKFQNQNFKVSKKSCPRDTCKLKCSICNICIHDFVCSCPDSLYVKTICKHIHFVASKVMANRNPEDPSNINDEQLIETEENVNDNLMESRKNELGEIIRNRKSASTIADIKREIMGQSDDLISLLTTCNDIEILKLVQNSFKTQILPLMKHKQFYKEIPLEISKRINANQNVELQPRFKLRKESGKRKGSIFHSSNGDENAARKRVRGYQTICSSCNKEDDTEIGADVDWLQCDVCDSWHHKTCVSYASIDENFKS
uniref:C2H2-type domain-containing protein n=1 Tax=Strigamia maritima TaxID=126957 RepID=T1J6V6_STRMM